MPEFRAPGLDAPKQPRPAELREVAEAMGAIGAQAARIPDSYLGELVPVLEQAQRELRTDLRNWIANVEDGDARFTAQQYRSALLQLKGAFAVIKNRLPADMQATLEAASDDAGQTALGHLMQQTAIMGAVFGDSIRPIQLEQAAILAQQHHQLIPRYRNSANRYAEGISDDIRRQLAVGVARGETFTQLTNRLVRLGGPRGWVALRGTLGEPGSYAEHIAEGLFRKYRGWAERVVVTETLHSYNVHHLEGLHRANAQDPGYKARWDATSDRVCDLCVELDGKVVDIDSPFAHRAGGAVRHPPLHPRCRCTLTPWREEWAEVADATTPRPAPETEPHGERDLKPAKVARPKRVKAGKPPKPAPDPAIAAAAAAKAQAQAAAEAAARAKAAAEAHVQAEAAKAAAEAAKVAAAAAASAAKAMADMQAQIARVNAQIEAAAAKAKAEAEAHAKAEALAREKAAAAALAQAAAKAKADAAAAKKRAATTAFTHDPTRAAGGSQGGKWFKDASGQYWFGKTYAGDTNRLGGEHLVNQVYRGMGISAPETRIVMIDGQTHLMSKEIVGQGGLERIKKSNAHKGFVVDAWMANWDVVGLEYDNIVVDAKNKAHRIDNGGALVWRAMGAKKEFGKVVGELDTMRDPKFPSGKVFGKLTDKQLLKQIDTFEKQYGKQKGMIDEAIAQAGMGPEISEHVRKQLHARAEWLMNEGRATLLARIDAKTGKTAPVFRTFDSPKEAREHLLASTRKQRAAMSPAQKTAAHAYQGTGFEKINGALRGGMPMTMELNGQTVTEIAKNLDETLKKSRLPEPLLLYRGSADVMHGGSLVGHAEFNPRVGELLDQDPAFLSTTASLEVSFSFSRTITIEIEAPAGVRALYVNERVEMSRELELLFPRSTKLRVVSVREEAKGTGHAPEWSSRKVVRVRVEDDES